jgi:glycosyltransferase involved in cell wall biosynthesis
VSDVRGVLHCPNNAAGQSTAFRDALRDLGVRSDFWTFKRNAFAYPDDYWFDFEGVKGRRRKSRRLRKSLDAARHYDVVHFHCGLTLMRDEADVRILRLAGRKMLMTYWGSDARLYSVADERNRYYRLMGEDPSSEARRRERMQRIGRRIRVATVPDIELREHVAPYFDRVEVVPVIVRTKDVIPAYVQGASHPLVVHAPSKRHMKGTEYVLDAVTELRRRGVPFRFQLVENTSNERVKEVLAEADVLVDQLLLGICGMAGLEAMALGKPVITYLREDLQGMYPDGFPAVHATRGTLADVLEELLTDFPRRSELGVAGRTYVERHHSPEVLGAKLLDLYGSL